jgi:hypothetical protein
LTVTKGKLSITKSKWCGRESYTISNGLIRLVTLTGGGHIAELRYLGNTDVSPLWIPPWETIEPYAYRKRLHASRYGGMTEGKLLSGLTGHNVCLDFFGSPSAEESANGLSQHGEAPSSRWYAERRSVTQKEASLLLKTLLPVAHLQFERELRVHSSEPILYFRETVENLARADHFFHWTQHVTLGPPFLKSGEVEISLPGSKAMSFPHGYDEGKALLASKKTFDWPNAPRKDRGTTDLSKPLSREGSGYVAGVLLEPKRDWGFIAAVNSRLRLLIAYCFRRADFPWVTLWEENQAIEAVPWCKKTVALGLEFGTTPLPVPRRENFLSGGSLFGTPTVTFVPAHATRTVEYFALLSKLPQGFGCVKDISLDQEQILIKGTGDRDIVRLQVQDFQKMAHN